MEVEPPGRQPVDRIPEVDGDESSIPGLVNPVPLVQRLALTQERDDRFIGYPPCGFDQRVFGGHLVAQALLAAAGTIQPGRVVSSLHAYFLRSGRPEEALDYAVTTIRDGRSSAVRSVTVTQAERVLMTLSALFAEHREDIDTRSVLPPQVPRPEDLVPLHERRTAVPDRWDGINRPTREHWWTASRPLDVRYIDDDAPGRRFWFRAEAVDGGPQNLHRAIVAFASDRSLLPVIVKERGAVDSASVPKVSSVDHALWFHGDVRAGEWLLYVQDSPHSTERFGTARGLIHSSDGAVVASVVQQGLLH
ncbi:acyl-CoA thioesterase II [Nocardia sp. ET3-3]|uniref:Acyl-CoA thioesterase II n=1 Tax=Nocardia terrae TaxID=2675851 RepID=A0A7K1V3G9_9NOCA|nr:acyl-CoA thioesterase domain-containing protein [Nocardia terrae]MVU81183.1 acyl-CoA thioesterase II [Nocardia terrae]